MILRDLIVKYGDSNENWLILEFLLNVNIVELKLNDKLDISNVYDEFLRIKRKREDGYPLQYIFGRWEFYGIELKVTESALIPRFETEILVDEILKLDFKKEKILDIGTGTGAISLALAKNLPNSSVLGIDISEKAIELANENKNKLELDNVEFLKSDLFENVVGKYDLIVSNPPYIGNDEINTLEKELSFEPYNALYGGDDGLFFYREIIKNSRKFLNDNGIIAFEIGHNQMNSICEMLSNENFDVILKMKDFAGFDRIVIGRMIV